MPYKLDIYTWLACQGVNPEIRSTTHKTPQEAISYLDNVKEPYFHAVLMVQSDRGWEPCTFEGRLVFSPYDKWPARRGENWGKTHPDLRAFQDDFENLISMTIAQYDGGRGMIDIANELIKERHPNIIGMAHKVGWEAAGR